MIKRTDIVFFFDAWNSNPNGDPDNANSPRNVSVNNRGYVTDVCLKRKVRDAISLRHALPMFIEKDTVLADTKRAALASHSSTGDERTDLSEKSKLLCEKFFDVRAFGSVAGANKDSAAKAANVTGPVQFSPAQSVDPISILDLSITRCAAEDARDAKENKTMGSRSVVPYALYRANVFIDPHRAEKTGFDANDLDLFKEALCNLFEHDRASGRSGMTVRMVLAFEHECKFGTPGLNGLELVESIEVKKLVDDAARSFDDYSILIPDQASLPDGITLSIWKQPWKAGRKVAA